MGTKNLFQEQAEARKKAVAYVISEIKGSMNSDDFGIKIGCDRSFVYRLTSAKSQLSYPLLISMCTAFNIDLNEFERRVQIEVNRKTLKHTNK